MTEPKFVPLPDYREYPEDEMKRRAAEFYADMKRRRTVRHFSDRPVPREVLEDCIRAAGTSPSGANMQPWHFVVVTDVEVRKKIREMAEGVEYLFYHRRAPQEWLEVLGPLGTNENKPFLEMAPVLISIFMRTHTITPQGRTIRHYYPSESVGIATGLLLAAFHHAGLVTLTHTPSPMGFLNNILNRPGYERPYLLVIAGYPAEGAIVPDIERKPFEEIATFV